MGRPPPLGEMPPTVVGGHHETPKDPLGLYRSARDVRGEGGPVVRALCLLDAFHYAGWKDPPDGIPNLRVSVYRQHAPAILSVLCYRPAEAEEGGRPATGQTPRGLIG